MDFCLTGVAECRGGHMDLLAIDQLSLDRRSSGDDANGEPATDAGFDDVCILIGAVGLGKMIDAIDAQGKNLRPPRGVENCDGIIVTTRMAGIGRDRAESSMGSIHRFSVQARLSQSVIDDWWAWFNLLRRLAGGETGATPSARRRTIRIGQATIHACAPSLGWRLGRKQARTRRARTRLASETPL